jgi:hypothetical protein
MLGVKKSIATLLKALASVLMTSATAFMRGSSNADPIKMRCNQGTDRETPKQRMHSRGTAALAAGLFDEHGWRAMTFSLSQRPFIKNLRPASESIRRMSKSHPFGDCGIRTGQRLARLQNCFFESQNVVKM